MRPTARGSGAKRSCLPGFTLLEMVLVLVLSGIVLGVVSGIGNGLHRQLRDTARRIEIAEELSATRAILPLDLRSLSPADGDIRAGEARDSSLEMRSAVANGVVCGITAGAVLLAPFRPPGGRSVSWSAQPGDTLWVLADSDSTWRATTITDVRPTRATCPSLISEASGSVFDLGHLATLRLGDSLPLAAGNPIRVTRPIRYSLYRGGDGLWYLGVRSWNSAISQFNGVQPLSGPYAPPSPTGSRIEYFDADGNRIASGAWDTRRIARTEWVLLSSSPRDTLHPDSSRVVVAMRNRR